MKSFESRLTIFLSYSFIQRARTRARSFQCLYKHLPLKIFIKKPKSCFPPHLVLLRLLLLLRHPAELDHLLHEEEPLPPVPLRGGGGGRVQQLHPPVGQGHQGDAHRVDQLQVLVVAL